MNKTQKIITLIALATFSATLIFTPWEVVRTVGGGALSINPPQVIHDYYFTPIWDAPGYRSKVNLRYGVLGVWWVAIGALYGGGLLATRTASRPQSK